MDNQNTQRNVVITGCLRGIGLAVTAKFLENGWNVIGMSTCDDTVAKQRMAVLPRRIDFVSGNIASEEDRKKLVSRALEHGQIDALVNVAGVAPTVRADILEMTPESYNRVMKINAEGTLFLTQLAARAMIQNQLQNGIRGYICNISSMSAYTSSTSRGEYCISKSAVSMVTKLFADRLAEYGIPVNEIRPGIIKTDMTAGVTGKYDRLIEDGLLPIKRWGTPDDVAEAVYTVCSGKLPYMTGQSIDIDGGFHIRRL